MITLTTDFGSSDGFPAAMRGVIARINPAAAVADVTHEAPPQDIAHAAFVLAAVTPYFPEGSLHVAVVDPGVGGERRALAIAAPDSTIYVGPDNGVFTHVLSRGGPAHGPSHELGYLAPFTAPVPEGFRAHSIENADYMLPAVSATFHGRDVFAPAAAHLSLGAPVELLGPRVDELVMLNAPGPLIEGGRVTGHVQYVDRFGNLATDIPAAQVSGGIRRARIRNRAINGLSPSYSSAAGPERLACVIASHGFLEIAQYGGNAARELGGGVGDRVTVEL
ncbi:MAG: SAM hydrolase/SAM-dependent halogenase family protein [Chloroflexota bacterium]